MPRAPQVPRPLGAALALALLLPCAAPAARAGETIDNVLAQRWPAAGIARVDFDFPVGSLEVTAGPDDAISFAADAECSDLGGGGCADQAGELRLRAERRGDVLRVRIDGWRRFRLRHGFVLNGRLTVPARTHLDLEMGVGELTVSGVEGDLALGLGVGEAEIHRPAAGVRSVRVDIGIGEATLDHGARRIDRVSVLGGGLKWSDGAGRRHVALKMGVGEANVVLD